MAYLNPRNTGFANSARNAQVYVDKTMLIAETNRLLDSADNFLCVSRPRRFGKSMAGNMLAAYYSRGCDSRELFSPFSIAKDASFTEHVNKYNVLKFDLFGAYSDVTDGRNVVEVLTSDLRSEFIRQFPNVEFGPSDSLAKCIMRVYDETQETFVIIIDEYDCLVRLGVSQDYFEVYLKFLCSLFKNNDLRPAISLAYLTGILPIVREKMQSKLNEFAEYTMLDPGSLSPYLGFTQSEVRALCEEYDLDFGECARWYDGYHVSSNVELYNPQSVAYSIIRHKFGSYWSVTSSFEALRDYILMDFEGIKQDVLTMIGGGRVCVNVRKFTNTLNSFRSKDDVFTYLIHLGYLAYDSESSQCYIPNLEVRDTWRDSIEDSPDYANVISLINASRDLVRHTLDKDSDYVARALDIAHQNTTNPLTYNDEASFQSAIGLAYFYATAQYTIIKEMPAGRGYADVVFIPYVPNIPAIIVELKVDTQPSHALEQIQNRRYPDALNHYKGNILLVAISYNRKSKSHSCQILSIDK